MTQAVERGAPCIGAPCISAPRVALRAGRRLAAALATMLVLGLPGVGMAQGVPFVRVPTAPPTEPCADVTLREVSDAARRDARRLRDEAAASALAGDASGARDRLKRAAALDPADPDIAYRLARAHEDVGDAAAARAAFCHYRAVARTPQDVAEAEARLEALEGESPSAAASDAAAQRFNAGVARATAGDFTTAEREFTATLDLWPTHAATLLDRAAVRTVLGSTAAAIDDLDRYAAAVPAPLQSALAARDVLSAGRGEPTSVALAGIIPGGSQFATRRPITGTIVAAIAIAGVAMALESQTVEREQQFTDPFGNPYTDVVTVREYPRRAMGLSVSVAALLGGAIEGFMHAAGKRRAVERLQRDTRAAIERGIASDTTP